MTNSLVKEDTDLKSYIKMLIEILKQEREEKQKEAEAFKEETRKTLKELKKLEENTEPKTRRNGRRYLKHKFTQ